MEGDEWDPYGRALVRAMSEVLEAAEEDSRAIVLETADYWLSLGLAIGVERPSDAARLLALIGSHDNDRGELTQDADAFCEEALS